ncbi:MAG TPA: glycoside hydrolase [Ruminococcus sp.]|nr:glycoside hydrolase [Ruminococcus sp.]
MTKYGIDVSRHNGAINWNSVKDSGKVDFVILRAGYGNLTSQKDSRFEEYYSACKKLGIPVGGYWYSYAVSESEAVQEANAFLQIVKGKQFEYPLYFDIEEKKQFSLGREKCSAMARAFCETLENAGYYAGIYSSKSHLETHLTNEVRQRFAVWVAHYGVSQTSYSGQFGMWQKSSTGHVDGISGDVDLDECYIDYPEIVQGKGLNGFIASETVSKKNSLEIIVKLDGEIIRSETVKI